MKQALNAMLAVFASHNRLHTVVPRALVEMRAVGLAPDTHAYNAAIIAHKHDGDYSGACAVFTEMRADGVAADAHTWNSLFTVLSYDTNERWKGL
jgi:pentatricopeptide repeat protein